MFQLPYSRFHHHKQSCITIPKDQLDTLSTDSSSSGQQQRPVAEHSLCSLNDDASDASPSEQIEDCNLLDLSSDVLAVIFSYLLVPVTQPFAQEFGFSKRLEQSEFYEFFSRKKEIRVSNEKNCFQTYQQAVTLLTVCKQFQQVMLDKEHDSQLWQPLTNQILRYSQLFPGNPKQFDREFNSSDALRGINQDLFSSALYRWHCCNSLLYGPIPHYTVQNETKDYFRQKREFEGSYREVLQDVMQTVLVLFGSLTMGVGKRDKTRASILIRQKLINAIAVYSCSILLCISFILITVRLVIEQIGSLGLATTTGVGWSAIGYVTAVITCLCFFLYSIIQSQLNEHNKVLNDMERAWLSIAFSSMFFTVLILLTSIADEERIKRPDGVFIRLFGVVCYLVLMVPWVVVCLSHWFEVLRSEMALTTEGKQRAVFYFVFCYGLATFSVAAFATIVWDCHVVFSFLPLFSLEMASITLGLALRHFKYKSYDNMNYTTALIVFPIALFMAHLPQIWWNSYGICAGYVLPALVATDHILEYIFHKYEQQHELSINA